MAGRVTSLTDSILLLTSASFAFRRQPSLVEQQRTRLLVNFFDSARDITGFNTSKEWEALGTSGGKFQFMDVMNASDSLSPLTLRHVSAYILWSRVVPCYLTWTDLQPIMCWPSHAFLFR
ncbi:hypothetical protein K435DRAFT_876434 [Dendrothele bispora CBS 962.96]|uniref:Uncharacterized protein n=1 Tax=Dendrothele bispora (strain CBS 962.96) TaxID=1314807 RepID=A0A4S8KSE3_DENBC|nr:hypothetical protein K435DRAFT_876434 [Dendrothele bispora CBS 962.96]